MCLGAPLFAALVARWDRRRLLTGTLIWYAVLHPLGSLMPSIKSLLPVRAIALVSPAFLPLKQRPVWVCW
jgi:predicted MFS family arabinose efflux permease